MKNALKAAEDPAVTHVRAGHPPLKRLQDTVSAVEGQRAAEVASGKIKWWSVISTFQVLRPGGWMVGKTQTGRVKVWETKTCQNQGMRVWLGL